MDGDVRSGLRSYPLSTTVSATDEFVRWWDPLNRSYWIGQPTYANLAGGALLRAALRFRHAPAPFFATFPAT